jgi:hypothetical protein
MTSSSSWQRRLRNKRHIHSGMRVRDKPLPAEQGRLAAKLASVANMNSPLSDRLCYPVVE